MRSSGLSAVMALAALSVAGLVEIPTSARPKEKEPQDREEQEKRLAAFHTRLSEERRQRAEYDAYNAAVSTRQVRRARARGKAV